MIQLAFYKAKGDWQDKVIRIWTKGPYSHVELIMDGYMYSSSPADGKVRKKPHVVDDSMWEYVNIPNLEVKHILEFFDLTKNEKYDYMGILGFIIPLKDRTNDWFCSEWCSNALKISGYEKMYKLEPSKLSPNGLYNLIKG